MSDESWFHPRRNGYGGGLPARWQGWALTAAYVAVILATPWIARQTPEGGMAIALAATISFLLIAARTTRGGWRWRRNGKPE